MKCIAFYFCLRVTLAVEVTVNLGMCSSALCPYGNNIVKRTTKEPHKSQCLKDIDCYIKSLHEHLEGVQVLSLEWSLGRIHF